MSPRKIALFCCSKRKQGENDPTRLFEAQDIYLGNSFRRAKESYRTFGCEEDFFILSAKHHLLARNTRISYYDVTLNSMPVRERKEWARIVLEQLKATGFNLEKDEFYIFGGRKYYEFLIPHLNCTVFDYKGSNSIDLSRPTTYRNGGK